MIRRLNYRLLLGLTAAVAVGVTSVAVVHGWQSGRQAAALLAEAGRAEDSGAASRAAESLKRYLTYRPDDADALGRYGRLLAGQARTAADRERALSVYEEVLTHEPSRQDARRAAVDLAMEQGAFDRAARHLELLLHYRPDDGELEDLLGQCQETEGDAGKAAAAYRDAISHAPGRVGAYVRLARLLHGRLDRPSEAGRVMDDLVAANDHDSSVYVERAAYHVADGDLEGAEQDAARARELAPDDARVLGLTADLAARRGRIDDARAALERGLKRYPADPDLRLGLARLELNAGRPSEAAGCLEAAGGDGPRPSEWLVLLAEARLQQGRPEAVEALAAEARRSGEYGTAEYLDARLEMYAGRWGEAAQTLLDASKVPVTSVGQGVRILLCAAACYERLGDDDRRLAALRQAVGLDPSSAAAGVALGAALLDAGRAAEALEEMRGVTGLPGAPEAAWGLMARVLLLRNQTMPQGRRDWQEVDRALDRAGRSPEAARVRAAVLRARGKPDEAAAVLDEARSRNADDPDAWTAAALDAVRRGDADKASALLADARRRLGDRVEFRLAALRACAGADGADAMKTLQDLERGLESYKPGERTLLLCRLAETYYQRGDAADGDRICRRLAAGPADDLSGRLLLMEAVLPTADDALADGVLADVRQLGGDDDSWYRHGRAARLLTRAGRGDRGGLREAHELLADLGRRRPDWSRVALLQGRLAELEGDRAAALAAYGRAFDLGERRPDVGRALAEMLAAAGRWDDADQVLRKLQEQVVFQGALARRAAEIALRAHNGDRAVELARLAAAAEDGYSYHVWLGRLLAAAGRGPDGEAELRKAVRYPNAGWDATAALAEALARADRPAEALAAVEELKKAIPPRYAALPLGASYEAAGRLDLAEPYYDEAARRRPDDAPTLASAAAFYLRLNRAAKAEPLLRRLMQSGEAPAADQAWARRELAMVLAGGGDPAKVDEAAALVGPRPNEGTADRRARAFVQGSRPEDRDGALRLLEEEAQASPLPPDEQFRLARLYDTVGSWPQARDLLIELVTSDRQNPEYLARLIDGLLRHDGADDARRWLVALESLEPGSARVKEFQARLVHFPGAARMFPMRSPAPPRFMS